MNKLKIDVYEDLWRTIIGSTFVPPRQTFSRWAASYSELIFSRALQAAHRKMANAARIGADFTEDQILRYVSGTCAHIRQELIEEQRAVVPSGH
jgi:hypothetical protein